MSYGIWLEVDVGGSEPVRLEGLDWNYTSNVAPMWRRAMPDSDGLAGLAEMQGDAAAAVLAVGIERMQTDPDSYRAMNPKNGWGDFDSQLEMLRVLLAACRAAPRAKVAISR